MSKSIIMRAGATVTAVIDGEYRNYIAENEEAAVDMVKQAVVIKETGSQEDLVAFFNPSFRILEVQGVEKDRAGNFYLAGTDLQLPELIVRRLKEHIECGLPTEPLINFWKLLITNENTDVREDLFSFADRFNFPITSMGYFIAYKSVAWIGERHKDFGLMASQKYVQMMAAGKDPNEVALIEWGNNPDYTTKKFIETKDYDEFVNTLAESSYENNYDLEKWLVDNQWEKWSLWLNVHPDSTIEEIEAFALTLGWVAPDKHAWGLDHENFKLHGTVKEVFEGLAKLFTPDEPMFTDWHTRKMDIRLGVPVSMEMADCDTDRDHTCSSGLHVGAPGYVRNFYGGGDRYVIACLVNPADVAAIPTDYSFEKMRTAQYYPYAVCEINDEGTLKELDTKFFESDYLAYEAKELEEKLALLKSDDVKLSEADKTANEDLQAILQERLILLTT